MKKILFIIPFLIILFASCGQPTKKNEVQNIGKILVEDGKKNKDSVAYECVGCHENIKDTVVFQNIIADISLKTRNSLKYPLSFIPTNIELEVKKADSLYYYYDNNQPIDSLLICTYKYNYIAKNAYGNELEGNSENLIYIKSNEVVNLSDELKLDDLSFISDDGFVSLNRDFIVFNTDGDGYIKITPYYTEKKPKELNFLIKSSFSCVDKNTKLIIGMEDGSKIEKISFNDFNCKGNLYYWPFTAKEKELLGNSNLEYIYLYYEKSIMCIIPKNKKDYFIQLMELDKNRTK